MRVRLQGPGAVDGIEIDLIDNVVILDDLGKPLALYVSAGVAVWSKTVDMPNFDEAIQGVGLNLREMPQVTITQLRS